METKERFEVGSGDLEKEFMKYEQPVEVIADRRAYYDKHRTYNQSS